MIKTPVKKSIKTLDFNCDLAQGYGVYKNSTEYDFLDYVSSVNISCGAHAGDPQTIRKALLAAKEKSIVIGAHIGYSDIQGFGYRAMDLSDDELEALVIYQVGALMSFAKAYNNCAKYFRAAQTHFYFLPSGVNRQYSELQLQAAFLRLQVLQACNVQGSA